MEEPNSPSQAESQAVMDDYESEQELSTTDLRVAIVADDESLYRFGPVLRRLTIGLIDEVADLSLVSLEPSKLLEYLPSPPLRLITVVRGQAAEVPKSIADMSRQKTIQGSSWALIDKILPNRQVNQIAEELSKYKPTLLHGLGEGQVLLTRRLSKQLRIPYVASLLNLERIAVRFSDERCGGILPCSSSLVRKFRQDHPLFAKRVHLLPIGTHVSERCCCFEHSQSEASMMCCLAMDHNRGHSDLINAMKRLIHKGHQVSLTLSGQGPAERDLRRQVQELDLVGQVHFLPPIEQILSMSDASKVMLRESDIFVQPAPADTWQPELLEAMSVGNAVVAAAGFQNDLIVHEKTALTYPFRDEKALTDVLERLLSERQKARELAQNAQLYLRKHFLVSRMISKLAKAYRQALRFWDERKTN